ncbi:MAG: FAD-dependent oxidoreductase [Flavobacterium sp.]|uniref:NAD(P)/FAD-dependent oxidoreductase n=1 Tax=Flavobacterium sp. TaxID=239 RepID=UPI000C4FF265|nr:FAD-dependent oxidoreductase [Flavobacterium sp.]MBF04688.1 FAD-dependent oxidoreductase [Flavobacterium sp.]|tara:strand:- start:1436 stop:2734 length:1299 start_codon:yes stop_codon:yes gene_type:complete
MEHVVIIGNGISGVTLARHIRKNSDKRITIISEESEYFFSRTALMYVYMGHMKFEHTQPYEANFWKKNKIELLFKKVTQVLPEENSLRLNDNTLFKYDRLVIATGSKPNKFGWPGQDATGVLGLYHKQDLEKLESLSKDATGAVIVGGGLIGIELAEMLVSRKIPVTFLVRETHFWGSVLPEGEAKLIGRHIKEHHIDLRLATNLKEIVVDETGRAKAVITEDGEEIPCNIVGLTVGVSPNIDFLKDSGIETNKGVLVNRYLETNYPNVYAIGDCAEQREAIGYRRPVEAVWYTGRMMGEVLAQTICGNKMPYTPGHWFNSAKFLDIEYQTYGWVWAKPKEYEQHLYWEHPSGKKAVRIAYHKGTHVFLGINTFGIRMRHEFFDAILTAQKSVTYVIENLKKANFDPEFYKHYEKDIALQFKNDLSTLKTVS